MINFKKSEGHKFAESPVLLPKLASWRSRTVFILILFSLAALIGAAYNLQVLNNDFFLGQGESRYLREIELPASRGQIADRHGEVLAISTPMKSIWAIPTEANLLTPTEKEELASLVGLDKKELARKLNSEKSFVFLQRYLPPEQAAKIAKLNLRGIGQDGEYRRYYPSGEMTAHLVGFTGVNDKGQEGMELAFQKTLHGQAGGRSVLKDRRGQIVEERQYIRAPQNGDDVHLSIDSKLQYLAYEQLKQSVKENKARAGGVIIADVKTGEILALANWPTFNPNNRERLTGEELRNRAVTDIFEPGSTLKPFTAALALDKGKIRPNTMINTGAGKLTIGSATISDSHPNGVISITQIIQKSSNIGMAKIAAQLSYHEMWTMFDQLGFGQTPKLGFPGEVAGKVRPWKSWQPIEQATMSYGHGISMSLVQLTRAYMALARDGDVIPLSLIKQENEQHQSVQVFSKEAAKEMRAMLETVVLPGGTAVQAQVPGYRVAGKTGTAYKIEKGKYVKKYVADFVGFAPASNPQLIVAVMLDEPTGGRHFGGDVAGPTFSNVMGGALRILGVAQDAPLVNLAQDEKHESKRAASL